jgi:hypothetical protein
MRNLCLAALLISSVCLAQPPAQASHAATRDEIKFLRFLLLNVASLDHSQVSPATAARLRAPGHIMATAVKRN